MKEVNIGIYNFLLFAGFLQVSALDVSENEAVIIECPVDLGEYPAWTGPDNLKSPLTNGSQINENDFEWANKTNLMLTSAQTFHSGNYTCSNGSDEGIISLNVISHALVVEFLDTYNITGSTYVRGNVSEDMTVTCQVSGGRPQPTFTFSFKDNMQNAPNLTEPNITSELTENKTYTVNASVTFIANASLHLQQITCSAANGGNATEKSVTVYVLNPPLFRESSVKHEGKVGSSVTVACFANSRPETSFKWLINAETAQTGGNIAIDNTCLLNDSTMLYKCEENITVSNLQKTDTGKNISCEYIFDGEVYGASDPHRVSVRFEPTKATITGEPYGLLGTDSNFSLTCSSDASNPVSKLRWSVAPDDSFMNHVYINSTHDLVINDSLPYDGSSVSQVIDIPINRSMQGQYVFCCVYTELDVCDKVQIDLDYPPVLLAPQLTEYRVYAGENVSVPCIADSKPISVISWYRGDTNSVDLVSNNTANPSNIFYLQMTNVKNDSKMYTCKAWLASQGSGTAVVKSIEITVVARPPEPSLNILVYGSMPYVGFSTSDTAPDIPRKFFLQYRKADVGAYWVEIQEGYEDTLPGMAPNNYRHDFQDGELSPDTKYEIRLKSVDALGLTAHYTTNSFRTMPQAAQEDTVSYTKYRNAILISVFATAALFIIIIIGIVCLVKHGKCISSSAKSYVM